MRRKLLGRRSADLADDVGDTLHDKIETPRSSGDLSSLTGSASAGCLL